MHGLPGVGTMQRHGWKGIQLLIGGCLSPEWLYRCYPLQKGWVDSAQLFLEKCVCFMGLPNEIVSDQDHLISSKFFSTLCGLVGIEQHFSIIYRPKGNGRAEAAVRAIVQILRLSLADIRLVEYCSSPPLNE